MPQTYDNRSDADLTALHDRFHEMDYQATDSAAIAVHHGMTAEMWKRGIDHGHAGDAWSAAVVESRRDTFTVQELQARADTLPGHLADSIRQAADQGYSSLDVVGWLKVNGWEVGLVPTFPAEVNPAEPLSTPDAEEPDADSMEEGLYRRLVTRIRDALGLEKDAIRVGSFVRWGSSGGTAQGRVERIVRDGKIDVPASSFTITGTEDDPAALIRVWRKGADGWAATDTLVGHRMSTLQPIQPLTKAADTYDPPKGAQEAAQRALQWIKDGHAGSGFTDVGRARAAQLARGDAVSLDTVKRMANYFSRHTPDTKAEGFNSGEDGFPSPGRVAWDAWGGDPGKSWSQRIVAGLDKATPAVSGTYTGGGSYTTTTTVGSGSVTVTVHKDDPNVNTVHVDTIMQPRRRRGVINEDMAAEPYDPEDALAPRQQVLYEAYEAISEALGPWNAGVGPDGAHYAPGADNPFRDEGLACQNCVFYEGGGGCELLDQPVEPEGICKLWIIPEQALPMDAAKAIGPHGYKVAESGTGCSVCGQVEDNWRHAIRKTLTGQAAFTKAEGEYRYTLGPWYVPNMEDAHGEWTDPIELQSALWDYVRSGDRRIRLQHNTDVVAGEWVEAVTWPYEVTVPMLQPDGSTVSMTFPPNTAFLGVQWEPWAWAMVKTGRILGYSIGGTADRLLVDLPEGSSE